MKRYAKFGYAAPLRFRVFVEKLQVGGGGQNDPPPGRRLIKVILYMFRCVLTRQTRWCQNHCSIISNTEVIIEKLFLSKMPFFNFSWPLTPKQLILGEIWRHLSERTFKSFLLLLRLWRSSYRDRDNANNMKPCHVIRKFWEILPLMTSGELNFDST